MLLSISESKIAEELRSSSDSGYAVTSIMVEGPKITGNAQPNYAVSGANYAAPILVTEESRAHLMSLRRGIEESGAPLKNAADLSAEIGKMRRND
jgi:hypothetical protein